MALRTLLLLADIRTLFCVREPTERLRGYRCLMQPPRGGVYNLLENVRVSACCERRADRQQSWPSLRRCRPTREGHGQAGPPVPCHPGLAQGCPHRGFPLDWSGWMPLNQIPLLDRRLFIAPPTHHLDGGPGLTPSLQSASAKARGEDHISETWTVRVVRA